jgi:hypothetical protein
MIASVRVAGTALVALACMGTDCGAGGPLESDVVAGGEIRGVVTANGLPRGGVTVTLRQGAAVASTVTSGDGAYEFFALSPGVFVVTIEDLPGMQCVNAITATIAEGEETEANFLCTTPSKGSVTGRVTVNGFGVGGIVVSLREVARAIPTDGSGAYRFTDVPSGSETVRIGLPGSYLGDCPVTSQEVAVRAGGTAVADFECPGHVLTGRLTLDGRPWPAVVVLLCGYDVYGELVCDIHHEVTDSEGRFLYTSLTSRINGWDGFFDTFMLVEPPLPGATCPSPAVAWGTPILTVDIPCQGQ